MNVSRPFNCTGAIYETGRRKDAKCKVWLKEGSGKLLVKSRKNEYLSVDKAFPTPFLKQNIFLPLNLTSSREKFDILCAPLGGGVSGQSEAMAHGISKALNTYNRELYRPILKASKLLTRDCRSVESKKTGLTKARKKPQSSKR